MRSKTSTREVWRGFDSGETPRYRATSGQRPKQARSLLFNLKQGWLRVDGGAQPR